MHNIDIAVVDYGMGNLRSVYQALAHVAPNAHIVVTDKPEEVAQAARVVFPGQGAMPDCIRELDARGLRSAIVQAAQSKPFLGICIGMQMLLEHSEEGNVAGLGLVKGSVKRFNKHVDSAGNKLKIPHMGWNHVHQTQPHALWAGINTAERFYYVHSYYVAPTQANIEAGYSEYPQKFVGAIAFDHVFAVQFHPEKSAKAGLQLLQNFVNWKP